ncbi:MAG: hypothetical protein KTR28_05885 [Micavibrio sp.]|nr:hypothetical protein [Micavibrio sp.]
MDENKEQKLHDKVLEEFSSAQYEHLCPRVKIPTYFNCHYNGLVDAVEKLYRHTTS